MLINTVPNTTAANDRNANHNKDDKKTAITEPRLGEELVTKHLNQVNQKMAENENDPTLGQIQKAACQ